MEGQVTHGPPAFPQPAPVARKGLASAAAINQKRPEFIARFLTGGIRTSPTWGAFLRWSWRVGALGSRVVGRVGVGFEAVVQCRVCGPVCARAGGLLVHLAALFDA